MIAVFNMDKVDGGWIGVDLDGVLAHYDGFKGNTVIGEPIRPMIAFVKSLLKRGEIVKIFTSRAEAGKEAVDAIKAWLIKNGLPPLEVTNVKDHRMILAYDDRSRRVQTNTGRILS